MTAFIGHGHPEYGWAKKLQALLPIDYDNFRRRVHSCRDKLPDTHAGLVANADKIYLHDLIMDGDEVQAWSDVGVDVTMSRIKGLASNAPELHNIIYQISVANVGLLQITRVEVEEDLCTDSLQSYLDQGWRILAVCPPNDTRRPTYVLGHTDPRAKL